MQAKIATLVLPATLAVTTFGLVNACQTSEDGGEEVADESGDTGGAACYDIADMAACEGQQLCLWNPDFPGCVPACEMYQDQASCSAVDGCLWESSDGGFCLGPLV